MKSTKFLRVGDPQKYNENAGFLTPSKFTYLENLYVHGIYLKL